MMKNLFLVLSLVITFSTAKSQNVNESRLIVLFYTNVYDQTITLEKIVQNYIVYTDTIGYKNAIGSLEALRQPVSDANEHFSLLKKDIENKDYILSQFDSFDENEKAKFQYLEKKDRVNIFKLSPKNTIQQYILIQGNKIRSFFGFQKTGADSYTFIIY